MHAISAHMEGRISYLKTQLCFLYFMYNINLISLSAAFSMRVTEMLPLYPLFKGSQHIDSIRGGYWSQSQLSLWGKAGYTLNESPARALIDGRGCHARCQLHVRSLLRHVAQLRPREDWDSNQQPSDH